MISYSDGTVARVGDQVDFDGEPTVVEAVIDSEEQRAEQGLTDRGCVFKTKSFRLVFEPFPYITNSAIVFLNRQV